MQVVQYMVKVLQASSTTNVGITVELLGVGGTAPSWGSGDAFDHL